MDFRSNTVHLRIPHNIAKKYEFLQIDEIQNREYGEPPEIDYMVVREGRRPWLDINYKALDWTIGVHVYRVALHNPEDNTTELLYFSYNVQSDCPEKSYVYMNQRRTTLCQS